MLRKHIAYLSDLISITALQRASFSSTTTNELLVSSDVAQIVSLRSSRMMSMPADLQSAIATAAADITPKDIKLKSAELTSRLKHMSRTKHRGGTAPNYYENISLKTPQAVQNQLFLQRLSRGKNRQAENKALTALTRTSIIPITSSEGPNLDPYFPSTQTNVPVPPTTLSKREQDALYNHQTAAAYAASRMPACYAALHRVLTELHRLQPDFRPKSVLDFGSGPGTAAWAVRDIWRGGRGKREDDNNTPTIDVLAVEPAAYMAALGQDILHNLEAQQQQQREKKDDRKRLSSSSSPSLAAFELDRNLNTTNNDDGDGGSKNEEEEELEPAVLNMRWSHKLYRQRGGIAKQHDLVIAGYVLAEIDDEKQRRTIVEELWSHTKNFLILVDPGTPTGSQRILQARAHILSLANDNNSIDATDTNNTSTNSTNTVTNKKGGAYVVAPCPHDGQCSLHNRRTWCHFVQRFERTAIQRAVKVGTGGSGARTYQDERYSYVVLARGSRQQQQNNNNNMYEEKGSIAGSGGRGVVVLDVSGKVRSEEVESMEYLNVPEGLIPKPLNLEGALLPEYDEEEHGGYLSSSSQEDLGDNKQHNQKQHTADDGKAVAVAENDLEKQKHIDALTQSLILKSLGKSAPPPSSSQKTPSGQDNQQSQQQQQETDSDYDSDDDDFEAISQEELHQLEQAIQQHRITTTKTATQSFLTTTNTNTNKSIDTVDDTVDEYYYGEDTPEAVATTLSHSTSWSRIIRMPRKRSGHIVLDICSAVDEHGNHVSDNNNNIKKNTANADGGNNSSSNSGGGGVLLRQTVSKGNSKRSTGGLGAYKLAKKALWGDVWPLPYQRKLKAVPPPSGTADE